LPSGLYCFNYHRVGDPATTDFDRGVYSCTAQRFEEHVVFVKEKCEVLNLDRLSFFARHGYSGRKPLALITLDDGYSDNYSVAFPILRKYGVSAVFFLPTAFIGTSRLPWWDEIAWQVRRVAGKTIRLEGADEPFPVGEDDAERNIHRVLKYVKSRPLSIERQVEEIRGACGGCSPPRVGGERLFMSWAEVREMRSLGMDIGSHTHTHRLLAHLDRAEQMEELGRSKEILEGVLGDRVTSVAYPVGSRAAYTQETCELAEAAGYSLGFNYSSHNNPFPLSRPLEIGRLAVDDNISPRALRSVVCFPRLFGKRLASR
ncbi:MAG TPA: polysaccharide deacetylase family protein, partial [Gemmataceae bacterium]|nr:polysaccharide deacetylase family protein [Gemmataceae bacterium]